MDDDFGFGTSVWGAPDDPPLKLENSLSSSSIPAASSPVNDTKEDTLEAPPDSEDFDEFDDFDAAATTVSPDDDFGDFGDFGDAQNATFSSGFNEEPPIAGPSRIPLQPLRLHPLPTPDDLREQVERIIAPIYEEDDIAAITTNEEIRQAEGISQILLSPET